MIINYIDPGQGSLLIQVLIAGFISVLVYLKSIKLVVSNFFKKLFTTKKKDV